MSSVQIVSQCGSGTANLEQRWFAAYTCSRHEKQVARYLETLEVEHFLPVFESLRRWRDRRATVEMPLFPGYVFVHIALENRLRVLQVPSVVRLVGTNGQATPLCDDEIDTIRKALNGHLRMEPYPYLKVGHRVRVRSGPMEGAEGILIRKKGAMRLVISLDLIMRSVAVEMDGSEVEPVPDNQNTHSPKRDLLKQ